MLGLKIVIFFLTLVTVFFARSYYEKEYDVRNPVTIICGIVSLILGIVFCVLLNKTLFIIPKILLFITLILVALFDEDTYDLSKPTKIGLSVTIIAYIVAGILWINNFENCEVPEVTITQEKIICAKDNSEITGSITGSIIYIDGSISEESVYKYYYTLDDGGIKQGTIPANATTIYLIEPGEDAYLETIVTTTYLLNNNNNPATRCVEESTTTYNLHIPRGSITNLFELDAD